MRDAHEELAALAPAYALDALDPAEREVFESHLSHCASCTADVRAFMRIASAVGVSAPDARPRAEVRQLLLDRLHAGTVVPGPARRVGPSRAAMFVAWGSVAALLAIAIGLATYATTLRARVADLQSQLERETSRRLIAERALTTTRGTVVQTQAALDVLLSPDLARIDLASQPPAPSARALALWSRQRGMVFTASNLPQLPAGRTYQVWVVTAHAKLSAGLITPDPRGAVRDVFSTPPDIEPPVAVAVTLEPAGGVPQPTGAFYLLGAVKG
jgi:anti-sigma-K factor RskA